MGVTLFLSTLIFAEIALPLPTKEERKQVQVAATMPTSGEVMIIDPKARASDLAAAFSFLKKSRASSPIFVELANGQTLTNIQEMTVLKGGTLVIFQINSAQGQRYIVEKIESIESIKQL